MFIKSVAVPEPSPSDVRGGARQAGFGEDDKETSDPLHAPLDVEDVRRGAQAGAGEQRNEADRGGMQLYGKTTFSWGWIG